MRLLLACLASALLIGGCQVLLSTDRVQCDVDADCTQKAGPGFACSNHVCAAAATTAADAGGDGGAVDDGTPWGCIASPPPRAVEDRSKPVLIRARYLAYSLLDCVHNRPVPGMELKLCSQRDVSCGSPVEVAVTDCDGYANFRAAYRGFEGFVLAEPPRPKASDGGAPTWPENVMACYRSQYAKQVAEGKSGERCALTADPEGTPSVPIPDDLVSGVVALVPPPSDSDDPNLVIPEAEAAHFMSTGTLRSLLGVVGQPFEEKAGHLLALAVDCQGKPASDVSITVSGGIGQNSQLYYTDTQGLPNVNQGETSERGETGYLNLETSGTGIGIVTVTANRVSTGQRVGVYAALTRSGYITYLPMPPLRN